LRRLNAIQESLASVAPKLILGVPGTSCGTELSEFPSSPDISSCLSNRESSWQDHLAAAYDPEVAGSNPAAYRIWVRRADPPVIELRFCFSLTRKEAR
jgi:hypothetical protein